ncbi:hypothetical protein AOL_s00210g65 [Orbilia oligospora ATCC 24927]|uniref:Clr5 domain-containing protein n=1 Tax=Arthrobotrys oligospora (strain ATCC 24927 / CBS 115.81 / DSM 1491) TaxID=756982 RepID=G1XRS1_ARTOA|nr:hypothetical protein AOL_s00210g65 [Orbilia oligospora ATCC 24927]EGX44193.1 hypothetical protein AOL_s00210g65 [Orbilia oligospora ATCC 24927]
MPQPRKRARRCPRLDDDEVKEEMRQLYQVLLLKPDEIAAEINKNYNLEATPNQVRDKINKLGYKKRLGPQQSEAIYRNVTKRAKIGKESEVIIDGVITISGKKLQRSLARNLNATKQYHISQGIGDDITPFELPGNIQICTPKASGLTLTLKTAPGYRYIPLKVLYKLPIWQFSHFLDKVDLRFQHPGVHTNNRVNEFQLQEPLKRLLKNDTPSIKAVCEELLPFLYIRREVALIELICDTHGTQLERYDVAYRFWRAESLERGQIYLWLDAVLEDIEKTNTLPKSHRDLDILFDLCHYIRGEMRLFMQMWDRREFPNFISEMEKYLGPSNTPLLTDNPDKLEEFLDLGLTRHRSALIIEAILCDDCDVAKIFLGNSNLRSGNKDDISRFKPMDEMSQNNMWAKVDISTFHRLVSRVVGFEVMPPHEKQCFLYERDQAWRRDMRDCGASDPQIADADLEDFTYNINKTLVLAACRHPKMVDYVLRVMKWANPSLTELEVVSTAVDLIPLWMKNQPKRTCGCTKMYDYQNPFPRQENHWPRDPRFFPHALNRFLRLGIDPKGTKLWRNLIWEYLDKDEMECGANKYKDILAHFETFLGCGPNIINNDIEFPSATLAQKYSDVFSVQNHTSLKPIEAALFLPRPEAFMLLLKYGALMPENFLTTDRNLLTKFVINGDFIQASSRYDLKSVDDLWPYRIEAADAIEKDPFATEKRQIEIHLKKEELAAATNLSLRSQNPFFLIKVFLSISRIAINRKVYEPLDLELLRTLFNTGISQNLEKIDLNSPDFEEYNRKYGHVLHGAIIYDTVEIVDILLEYEKELNLREHAHRNLSSGEFLTHCPFRERNYKYVPRAAECSIQALKSLIAHGFDINGGICGCPPDISGSDRVETALSAAIESGDMDKVVFVLQSGVGIYAPCGNIYNLMSGIEYAVAVGHLDATALILSIEPTCYPLALKAAEEMSRGYMKTYVRNWKPDLDDTTPLSGQNLSMDLE